MKPQFVTVDLADTMRRTKITIRFRNVRRTTWRLRVAAMIIRFALSVGGIGEVEFAPALVDTEWNGEP